MIDLDELHAGARRARTSTAGCSIDFHGLNPVAGRVLGLTGHEHPPAVRPAAPGGRAGGRGAQDRAPGSGGLSRAGDSLCPVERAACGAGRSVAGRTLAMEISPEDAVPYLDRVPYGVVELLRRLGATVVPSGSAGFAFCRPLEPRLKPKTTGRPQKYWPRWRGRHWPRWWGKPGRGSRNRRSRPG